VAGFSDLSAGEKKDGKYNELYTGGAGECPADPPAAPPARPPAPRRPVARPRGLTRPPPPRARAGQSGIAVQGRADESEDEDSDEVERLFRAAKSRGAREGTTDDLRAPAPGAFSGAAHTLAGGSRPAEERAEGVVRHVVAFYPNGVFTVDDGPPREVEDPANMGFINAIARGVTPPELEPRFPGQRVEVSLLRKGEDYEAPAEPVAFTGRGNRLGGAEAAGAAPAPAVDDGGGEWAGPDESQEVVSVTFRLADGSRQVGRFNLHHTVGDLRRFLRAVRPQLRAPFRLMVQDMPPRPLDDDSRTVGDEKLSGACVMQRG